MNGDYVLRFLQTRVSFPRVDTVWQAAHAYRKDPTSLAWVAAAETPREAASRVPQQHAGREHQRAAQAHLEGGGPGGRLHVTVPDPGDGDELDHHHGGGDD